MRNVMRTILGCFLLLGAPTLASAAVVNLAPNPVFDHDLAGWSSHPELSVSWATADELAGVGSAEVTNLDPLKGSWALLSDCVTVPPGEWLAFGGAVKAVGGDDGGNGSVRLELFANPDCTGLTEGTTGDLRLYFGRSTWGPAQGTTKAPAWAHSARLAFWVATWQEAPTSVHLDNAFLIAGRTCAETASTLCLANQRFRVNAEWRIPDGTRGVGRVGRLTADSGYLWFFDPGNVEMMVKVLDACGAFDRFWVFTAGLTNVRVDLTVTDTFTGEKWQRVNQLGVPFAPIQDASAFATCPPPS
jgi:hypothetical protein